LSDKSEVVETGDRSGRLADVVLILNRNTILSKRKRREHQHIISLWSGEENEKATGISTEETKNKEDKKRTEEVMTGLIPSPGISGLKELVRVLGHRAIVIDMVELKPSTDEQSP
jgi:hypothetical protein